MGNFKPVCKKTLMLKDSFFYTYFRSLRVVDKDVSAGSEPQVQG